MPKLPKNVCSSLTESPKAQIITHVMQKVQKMNHQRRSTQQLLNDGGKKLSQLYIPFTVKFQHVSFYELWPVVFYFGYISTFLTNKRRKRKEGKYYVTEHTNVQYRSQ
jgi:hypothetical protein